jgi:hypothetical protein
MSTAPVPVPPAPAIACTVTANPLGLDPCRLFGVARRHNARRSALFVSLVLGKHVPASPAEIVRAAELLAARVASSGAARADDRVVIAFAETATALGHLVRDGLAAPTYLHTTRFELEAPPLLAVEESHSHATSHRLYHRDPQALAGDGEVVLVDDEVTTGRTMLNIIAEVHARHPRDRYVVAVLLDWRDAAARAAFDATAACLGTRIDVISLVTGEVAGELVDGEPPPEPGPSTGAADAQVLHHTIELPGAPHARLGWTLADQACLDAALPGAADRLVDRIGSSGGPVLCVGTEELMYVPLRIAEHLEARLPGPVRYQSTTRSPIVVADVDGYPVRHGLRFPHHAEPGRLSRLYNVAPGAHDDVVVFVEQGSGTPTTFVPMARALAGTGARVHVVELGGRP